MDQEKDRKDLPSGELDEKLGGKYPARAQTTFREKMRDAIAKRKPAMSVVYGGPGGMPRRPSKRPEPEQCEIQDVYGGPEYFGAPDEEPADSSTASTVWDGPPISLVYAAPRYDSETVTVPEDPDPSEFLMVYAGPPPMPSMAEMMAVYAGPEYFNPGNPGFQGISTVSVTPPEEKTDPASLKEGQWFCTTCGALNTGPFCRECGSLRPKEAEE